MRIYALLLAAVLVAGCAPVINQRGYLPNPDAEATLQIGKDTKTTVQKRLGDPSLEGSFSRDAWYYVSSVEKQVAFFDPTVQSRSILAIYFDKKGKISDIKHYGLRDGHVVAFESRETPVRGRELTFLQQLFNSTPGVPLGGANGPGSQQNPGGGSGTPGEGGPGGY